MSIFFSDIVKITATTENNANFYGSMHNCLLLFSDSQWVTTNSKLYEIYHSKEEALKDFAGNQKVMQAIEVFFNQTPNPISVGGYLAVGAVISQAVNTPTVLYGGTINYERVKTFLEKIHRTIELNSNLNGVDIVGTFAVPSDVGSDFQPLLDLLNNDGTAPGSVKSPFSGKFTITYDLANSRVLVTVPAGATDANITFSGEIAELLGLTASGGAVLRHGVSISDSDIATPVKALDFYSKIFDFHGIFATDDIDTSTIAIEDVQVWLREQKAVFYVAISNDLSTVNSATSPTRFPNIKCVYAPPTAPQKNLLGGAMCSLMHGIDLSTNNSAMTLHLKTFAGVDGVRLTTEQSDIVKYVNIDFYSALKDTPLYFDNKGDGYVDNIYNLIFIEFEVQRNLANLIIQSKLVPQTTQGLHQIYENIGNTLHMFLVAGVLSKGNDWIGAVDFGLASSFKKNILAHGYYIYIEPLSSQTESERISRIAPPIHIAIKFAGAIHSATIKILAEY